MSFGVPRKLLSCLGISTFLWLAMPMSLWAQQACGSCATFGTPCTAGCQSHHCPPAFKYCVEGCAAHPLVMWLSASDLQPVRFAALGLL